MGETTSYLRQNPVGETEFLLGRARAGSETAWREILTRYRTMLVVQIQARIPGFARHRFDADDVLQLALGKAWLNIRSFEYRGEGSFRRWLATLVLREFQNELQAQQREQQLREPEPSGDVRADLEYEVATQREELNQKRITMLEQMGALEEEDRDILTMRHFEDMTFEAIAAVQGCSKEGARLLYERALERLGRRLKA